MRFFIIFLLISYQCALLSQTCGTIPTEEQLDYMRSFDRADFRDMIVTQGIIDIPVQFHVVRDDNGLGGISLDTLEQHLEKTNKLYIKSNIRFLQIAPINYINNTEFYNFQRDFQREEQLARRYNHPNAINIYCVNQIVLQNRNICFGYTYHPEKYLDRKIRIIMSRLGFSNNSSFVHELGHFFGLYHTHGKGIKGELPELIYRNIDLDRNGKLDCYERGDDLCDTPADPNIGNHNSYCSPNCLLTERINVGGQFYEPYVDNIMSYNPNRNCRTKFTNEQISRIAQFARVTWKNLRIDYAAEGQTVKGTVKFQLKNKKAMPISLVDVNLYRFDKSYPTGTSFLFKINNSSTIDYYVSILNMDEISPKVNKIPGKGQSLKIKAGHIQMPLKNYIKLIGGYKNKINEFICLLISLEPINHHEIAEKMEIVNGTFTQKIYSVLGDHLMPLKNIKYSSGKEISFEGSLRKGKILPVMLEMEHCL